MLKQYVKSIPPIFDALTTARTGLLLDIHDVYPRGSINPHSLTIFQLCAPEKIADFQELIDETINEDIAYQSQPLDLRNQRTYAVKVSHS